MAIRAVNSLSHYTEWTIGHVHARRSVGGDDHLRLVLRAGPWLWKRDGMCSARLVEVHFGSRSQGRGYVLAMWNGGILQA